MDINIEKMLTGAPERLRYVTRYATTRVQRRENVAEHSFYVAFYAMMICDWANHNSIYVVDKAGTISRALFHDLEEAQTGDFHRPFKHSVPELKSLFDEAASKAFDRVVSDFVSSSHANYLRSWWMHSKDDSIEGRVVKFADYLAVLCYIASEGPAVLNHLCLDTLPELKEAFESPDFDFIRPLVIQASEFYERLLNDANL